MPTIDEIKADLKHKLINQTSKDNPNVPNTGPGEPVDLEVVARQLRELLGTLSPEDQEAVLSSLTQTARGQYADYATFIQKMNPYGLEPVMVPDLKAASAGNLTDLDELRNTFGIEVAGWLQKRFEVQPMESSDKMMSIRQQSQSFHWEFQYPDDIGADVDEANKDVPIRRNNVRMLQITKAVRIPFIYRHATTGVLLLGHMVVGYEGAGNT